MKKGQLQFSFAWLFAIIVGAFILFLAIYAATKVLNTGQNANSAQSAKEISVLLNPLETGFETGSVSELTMPGDSRIYNQCDSGEGNFGFQILTVSQKSFGQWPVSNPNVSIVDKYIFSNDMLEGTNFYVFSKPFDFPFKVSDVIYLTPSNETYCFSGAPDRIRTELTSLKEPNIAVDNCSNGDVKICFNGENCDVNVNENLKTVEKNGQTVYYETDALMYAAIFSSSDVYECELQRLMIRESKIADLYSQKESALASRECPVTVNVDSLKGAVTSLSNSEELANVANVVDEVNQENSLAVCSLW